jgi:hypothetical protein
MRSTLKVEKVDSLVLAADRLRDNDAAVLPVVEDDRLVGVITESSLATAMMEMQELTDSVEAAIVSTPTIRAYETGAEALRRSIDSGVGVLVVVDDFDNVMGLVGATDLWPHVRAKIRPPMVGGMATPFGVYLTSGNVSAGVSRWALVATGMAMSLMLILATVAGTWIGEWLVRLHLGESPAMVIGNVLSYALFLALMRTVPLSGTHGAEHQVVHAIERDQELHPLIVRRMPRVHPRCGTNIAAAFAIFGSIYLTEWLPIESVRLLIALIATMLFWRPFGSFLQYWFTTKRPSDRQLESGIRAGNELLSRYETASRLMASPWQRLWNSGMLQVIFGATIMTFLAWFVLRLLGYDIPIV